MRCPAPSPAAMAQANSMPRKPPRTATRAVRLMVSAREESDGQVESLEGDGARDGYGHGDGAGHRPRRRELVGHRSRSRPTDPIADEHPLDPAAKSGQREARRVADTGGARTVHTGGAGGADAGRRRRL